MNRTWQYLNSGGYILQNFFIIWGKELIAPYNYLKLLNPRMEKCSPGRL